MATEQNIIAFAASVWPESSDITIRNDSPGAGFVLLALDAHGQTMQRMQAPTLDELQREVETARQAKD